VSGLALESGARPSGVPLRERLGHAGGLRRPELIWGYVFILPSMLGVLCFTLGPILASFGLMFTDWTVVGQPSFVGFDNFARLPNDDVFLTALRNTILYVALFVPSVAAGGFLLALLMDRKLRGIALFRTIYFMPSVCMFVAVAMVWQFLYQPSTGVFTYYLSQLGIHSPDWLGDQHWAMAAVAIMGFWRHVGYFALIYLAGLQTIPTELHEAAAVDGATPLERVRHITLPLVWPTTFFVLVIAFIEAFQLFGEPYVMTKGGPGYATTTLVYLIYRNAFEGFKMGYAATQSWVLFAIIFVVTFIQWRLNERRTRALDG
jgi:multiple sugar transport system permease protein